MVEIIAVDDQLMRIIAQLQREVRRAERQPRTDEGIRARLNGLRDALNAHMERIFGRRWEQMDHVGSTNIDALYARTARLIEPPHTRAHSTTTRKGHFGCVNHSERIVRKRNPDHMRPFP